MWRGGLMGGHTNILRRVSVFFSRLVADRKGGNGLKLHQVRFRLGISENFFTERVVFSNLADSMTTATSLETCSRSYRMPVLTPPAATKAAILWLVDVVCLDDLEHMPFLQGHDQHYHPLACNGFSFPGHHF